MSREAWWEHALTSEGREDLKNFWVVYEEHYDQISANLMREAARMPEMQGVAKELQDRSEEQRLTSKDLTRRAILEYRWEPYLSYLRAEGARYAEMGLSFTTWYALLRAFRNQVRPLLFDAYASSSERLRSSMAGMSDFIDIAMSAITHAYLQTRQDVIDDQITDLAEKAEELARINADLEQFAYVASHDLQEPLRAVVSYTQLLSRRYRGKLDSDADDFIDYAVEGANRVQKLVIDLLAYSRAGRYREPSTEVECDLILKEALSSLRVAIEESQAVIEHDQLPRVTVDHTALVQVFQNLISNAIKFRADEPPLIYVRAKRESDGWLFSVRDNGIGIDQQYFGRIFVIFQRLNDRDRYPGTGVGLAICKKVVNQWGGRIWAESKAGEGSTFFFTLPDRRRGGRQSAVNERS